MTDTDKEMTQTSGDAPRDQPPAPKPTAAAVGRITLTEKPDAVRPVDVTAKEQIAINNPPKPAPKAAPARKPTPPKKKPQTAAQRAALAKARDTKAANGVELTPALIRHVLEGVTLRFVPAFGVREAVEINEGCEHTVTFGPFPEAARTAADEWSDFISLAIAVDDERREYAVHGPHERRD